MSKRKAGPDEPEAWKDLDLRHFRRALLSWYRSRRRDLPWRRTRDPYRVWVSETMLQQTQVATVIPYYRRFIRRFPTLRALAAAHIDEVLPFWSGLGYYRRIRNLHAAAGQVLERHRGRIPRKREDLLRLPGIGRYTAGALLSIAFDQPEPVLDGNVSRVLCRLLELDRDPAEPSVSRLLWRAAAALVPESGAGDFNQALMELGATVCLPRKPLCPGCPVSRYCRARESGSQERLPRRPAAARSRKVVLASVLVLRGRQLLLVRRSHPTLMNGLWEVPTAELAAGHADDVEMTARALENACGLQLSQLEEIGQTRHAITWRRITLRVHRARLKRGASGRLTQESRWIAPEDLGTVGVSALSLKSVGFLDDLGSGPRRS